MIQEIVADTPPASEAPIFDRRLKEDRDYWIARLSPAPRPVAPIPERTQPGGTAGRDLLDPAVTAAAFDLDWPPFLGAELRRLARDSAVLVHVALTAALEACLHRLTGKRSTWIGSPALLAGGEPGRERQAANAIVVADEIDPRRTFRAHLLQVREVLLAAYARQGYPLLRLVEDLRLERHGGRCPFFDVALSLAGLHTALPEAGHGLTLSFALRGEGLAGRAEFDRRRFHRADVKRFTLQLQGVLTAALADLEAPLSSLEPLTAAERHQLLLEWNDTWAAAAEGPWVHERVAAQAALTPQAAALSWAAGEMSYEQLVSDAHRLARRLVALGVGAEARVGICLERSPEMAVAVLAILAAGGAYLPLDPALPRQRLAWMVEQAEARWVLTRQALAPRLPGSTKALCLDVPRTADPVEDASGPLPRVSGDQLAYVLFTSGSTGRPKGVMVSHRALLHYLSWCVPAYGAASGRGAPLHTSIGFDLTVTSLFSPWLAGREVWLVSEQGGIAELAAVATREPFSHVKLTPAHLEALGQQLEASGATGRAAVLVVGGEALRGELLATWRAHWPAARLVNEYGPTEAVVGCCVYEPQATAAAAPDLSSAAAAPDLPPRDVPIGRPIANTRIDLLAAGLELAGIGITGELYIGGGGLARGYLRQPELTAERFVPDPWGTEPGARRYRTGDLARRLPDGNLAFVGRADHQVKLRGYRVELGEIESVLRRHPGVGDAAVTAQRNPSTGEAARLVAYVVPATVPPPSTGELEAHLAELLPEHMRPAAWVTLAALPLSANGKLDRAALPPPAGGTTSRPYVAPRNAAEEVMAALWAELLGLERVGARDHFFDLGGHSLLATRLVARLRRIFQVELPLLGLFESPTVEGVVARVAALRGGMETADQIARLFLAVSGLPAAERQEAFERLLRGQGFELSGAREIPHRAAAAADTAAADTAPLSPSQDGIWFGEQMEGAGASYNLLAAARLAVPLDLACFARAVDEIVRRHEALRTRFRVEAGVPVQVVAPPRHLPITLVELAGLAAEGRDRELARLARVAARRRLDLACGPLLRVDLARLGQAEYVLLLTMHHIISDGWSMAVFFGELAALYGAFSAGRPSPLPELPIQYRDYAAWQRQWLAGGILEAQLAYWRRHLAGAPPRLRLPADRLRPPVGAARGATLPFKAGARLTAALRALARQEGATLFMVLLTGWKVLLRAYAGQDDVAVGTYCANRAHRDVEGLIGFFVNTLVLRTDLGGDPTCRQLLGRVRQTTLGAYAHQDLPFSKLVEALSPRREAGHNPLFQVVLSLDNFPPPAAAGAGLPMEPVPLHTGEAKFDLVLELREAGEALEGLLEVDTGLFEPATAARMLAHYHAILQRMADAPDCPISALSLAAGAPAAAALDFNADLEEGLG